LIRNDREPEFVGVKIEGAVLVGYGNADEFDLLNHDALNLIGFCASRPQAIARVRQKLLSVYPYSSGRIHFFRLPSSFILSLCLVSNTPFPSTITYWMC
jgi:hypothetical protein